jgi:hypothetical protein
MEGPGSGQAGGAQAGVPPLYSNTIAGSPLGEWIFFEKNKVRLSKIEFLKKKRGKNQ